MPLAFVKPFQRVQNTREWRIGELSASSAPAFVKKPPPEASPKDSKSLSRRTSFVLSRYVTRSTSNENSSRLMGQGVLAPRRDRALGGVDGPGHRGNPAPLWDGITPSTATPALHSAAFGGLLSARPRILWDSIPADGGVPPQLWNKTTRKTTAKANEIRASVRQLRLYGMIVMYSHGFFYYNILWPQTGEVHFASRLRFADMPSSEMRGQTLRGDAPGAPPTA